MFLFSRHDFRVPGPAWVVRLMSSLLALVLIAPLSACSERSSDHQPQAQVTGLPDFSVLVASNNASVVNINAISPLPAMSDSGDSKLDELLKKFFGKVPDTRPQPKTPERMSGSGFIIGADGYILTNEHVVDGAAAVFVRLTDNRVFKARVVGSDKRGDIALLKISANHLQPVRLGDSDKVRPGQWAVAIGSPFGFDHTVTAGIISAKGRSLPSEDNDSYVPYIQTDVAINPGSSGGPLFDVQGRVIGINAQIFTESGGYNGLSFAIPINYAMGIVQQLKRHGNVRRGFLGVRIQSVSPELAQALGMDRPMGALVSGFVSGSPAERSALEVGDVILGVNGKVVQESADLPQIIGLLTPGSEVRLKVQHERKQATVKLKLAELPKHLVGQEQPMKSDDLVLERFGLLFTVESKRVVVKAVMPNSVADNAGIAVGDELVSVNRQPITDLASVAAAFKAAEAPDSKGKVDKGGSRPPLLLLIRRDDQQHFLTLARPKVKDKAEGQAKDKAPATTD